MKIRTEKVIDVAEWDKLVIETYNRPYSFQQQDGCKDRGNFHLTVPCDDTADYENETVSEIDSDSEYEMGVDFAVWLKRNPKTPLVGQKYDFELEMWWWRNFYPDVQMIANDLHAKGLLKAGKYTIDIDW
jgi:hypothetical protein